MTAKPVKDFRYGSARVAVWLNQTASGVFYNVTISKSYRDKTTDEWRESNSFPDADLPAVAKAVSDAHSWIHEQKQNAETVTVES